jgi:molybdate transport system substrate-binding protein
MLRVLSALAVREVLVSAITAFTQESGQKVESEFGTMGALQARLAAGETADIAILARPVMESAQKNGWVSARTDLAQTGIALAIREGAACPDMSTSGAFVKALMETPSIALTDPALGGTAGIYMAALFERLGIADAVKRKTVPQRSGFLVAQCVAEGRAEMGITLISEIVPVEGAKVGAPLPAELQNFTTYAAGVFTASKAQEAAHAFINFLAGPNLRGRWKECGFDVVRGETP